MRIVLISILILLFLPVYCHPEASIGGLRTDDNLATIWKTMQMPDMIQARRRNGPETDQAVLMYQRQGAVYIGLTPYGDRLEHMLTESPTFATNDGIKVGDPRSTMVSKRGEPEETSNDQPGTTECWYWTQGINFAVDDKTGKIENIFIFPPQRPDTQSQRIDVPEGGLQVSHEYKSEAQLSSIVGRVSNKSDKPQQDVRIGITLYDKDHRVVDVLISEIGSLQPGAAFPFKADVQPRGQWTDYSVDCLTYSATTAQARRTAKASKLALTGRRIIVLPVADQAQP